MINRLKTYPVTMNPQRFMADLSSRFSPSVWESLRKDIILIPSFVDVHVHLREPGFFYKETIKTGTAAAARSGYSHLFAMPNLNPVPDDLPHLQEQLQIITRDAAIDVRPYGSITKSERGEVLSDMAALAPYVCGFSDDGVGVEDEAVMRQAMETAKRLGKLIVAHCEDMTLRAGGYIHDGDYARTHGHKGICAESEWKPIARDLRLAEEIGCAYHVCHISTRESVALIRQAKARGVDVTCETAPHYLLLSDRDLQEDGRFKMNPPIRSEADRQALLAGLLDGTIDMIATDHAPHAPEEKAKGLSGSAMGVTGLEAAFPVLYTGLVKTGLLSMERLIDLMSTAPRRRFGLPDAQTAMDYALWEIGEGYTLDPQTFLSKGKSTPFAGWPVFGRCLLNVANGKVVWQSPSLMA